ncbi:hypothetical protein C3F09_07395 [candidate division GN15 bacterium]|uniref:YncE family protein n=1 Tax=candidate division GN15 bacterium TaxID=2072418 RepID=A0A855X665_9BACT|nr:MAG: hypothetical protein C3F09_07395 [candidate division GN15 bacterium]
MVLMAATLLVFGGCGDDTVATAPRTEAFGVDTLLTGLEYPSGLWVRGDRVYFTETNGRNTSFGGAVRLSVYKVAADEESLLVDNPTCSDAVVVASDNKIYLASYVSSIPGESGRVSVVNPATLVETNVVNLEIATTDMFVETDDDIIVIGSSDLLTAKSLYQLPAANYAAPVVLKTGLGRTWAVTEQGSDTYYSDIGTIQKITGTVVSEWYTKNAMSLSASSKYLFYADYFAGEIGMINLTTKTDSVLVSGLNGPHAVRWVAATSRLYFTEVGTSAGQYKDGTLQVVKGIK